MRRNPHNSTGRPAGILLAAGLAACGAGPALAGSACTGTYTTSVLQPVPLPATIAMAETPVNPGLASQFLAGLQASGVQVDPAARLRLDLVFTIVTPTSGPSQGAVYNNFTWADQGGALIDVDASTINLSAQLMDTSAYAYVWIATARCTIQSRDAGAVSKELGNFIGRTIGRNVPDGRL